VITDQGVQLTCNVKDFEVTADKKIYVINLFANNTVDTTFRGIGNGFQVRNYANSTVGLTLLRDTPIFIDSNYNVDAAYNSEKLLAISAGIDGALWAV